MAGGGRGAARAHGADHRGLTGRSMEGDVMRGDSRGAFWFMRRRRVGLLRRQFRRRWTVRRYHLHAVRGGVCVGYVRWQSAERRMRS